MGPLLPLLVLWKPPPLLVVQGKRAAREEARCRSGMWKLEREGA
jgi:hypothetical protein